MRQKKARRLTKAELRAAGASPGLLLRRYDRDGRGRLEQLTSEAQEKPAPLFVRRLTRADEDTTASEGG